MKTVFITQIFNRVTGTCIISPIVHSSYQSAVDYQRGELLDMYRDQWSSNDFVFTTLEATLID